MRFLALVFLIRAVALAGDAPPRLLALDGGPGDGVPAVVERMLGEDAEIRIVMLRVPDAAAGVKFTAEVMLSGDTLAAPLGAGIVFKADAVATHPALIEGTLTLAKPDTEKSITQIVTLFRGAEGAGGAAKSKVASFTLRWVSEGECKSALSQAVAEDDAGRARKLAVCGSLPGLRERLSTWKIPFEDLGAELPPRFSGETIVIANDMPEDAKLPALADGASLLLFHSRPGCGLEVRRKDSRVRLTEVWLQGTPDWRRSALLLRLLAGHLTPGAKDSAP